MSTLHCALDRRFHAARPARPVYRPDAAEVRAAIARDLATLDAPRRRRYEARLSRLIREAETSRRASAAATVRRRFRGLVIASLGLTAAAVFAAAALALVDQPLAIRLALAGAALCAGLVGLDSVLRQGEPAIESLARQPAEVALELHRAAFAALAYAADLPPAPGRGRLA